MKIKRIFAAALFSLALCLGASAQSIGSFRVGFTGGLTSSDAKAAKFETSSYSLYHAGVAAQIPLGAGFAIQPALIYQVKGVSLDAMEGNSILEGLSKLDTKVGFLEIPVQLQWGPDLIAFRPYVFAEPFVGYALNTNNKFSIADKTVEEIKDFSKTAINRLEYGLGLGGGIDVWRIQVSAKYFWNFGSLYSESEGLENVGETIKTAFQDKKSFNGFMVSAAFFF